MLLAFFLSMPLLRFSEHQLLLSSLHLTSRTMEIKRSYCTTRPPPCLENLCCTQAVKWHQNLLVQFLKVKCTTAVTGGAGRHQSSKAQVTQDTGAGNPALHSPLKNLDQKCSLPLPTWCNVAIAHLRECHLKIPGAEMVPWAGGIVQDSSASCAGHVGESCGRQANQQAATWSCSAAPQTRQGSLCCP